MSNDRSTSEASSALVADVGGTNIRLAMASEDGFHHQKTWLCSEFETINDALKAYIESTDSASAPSRASIAVAGPVTTDFVDITNQSWSFSIEQLRSDLGLDDLLVVNDFTAQAAAIPRLEPEDVRLLKSGEAIETASIAVLGSGTGLGVGGLVLSRGGSSPLATEGGHTTLAATNQREWAVIETLQKKFGRVSNERVLSGPGLVNLYSALSQIEGESPRITTAAEIVERVDEDARCLEAVRMFSGWLGSVAGDLVLTLGALGGAYIGGGVIPKMGHRFDREHFVERFLAKGRYRSYMEPVPVYLVVNTDIAHLGLAALIQQR